MRQCGAGQRVDDLRFMPSVAVAMEDSHGCTDVRLCQQGLLVTAKASAHSTKAAFFVVGQERIRRYVNHVIALHEAIQERTSARPLALSGRSDHENGVLRSPDAN